MVEVKPDGLGVAEGLEPGHAHGAADDAFDRFVGVDPVAIFNGEDGAGGGEYLFAGATPGTVHLVEVDALAVVIFVEGEGDGEFAGAHDLLPSGDFGNGVVVEETVEIAGFGVEADVPDESPRVQAGENEEREFAELVGPGFGPGDETLGAGRFVAVDASRDIEAGGVLERGCLKVEEGKSAGDGKLPQTEAGAAADGPPSRDQMAVVVSAMHEDWLDQERRRRGGRAGDPRAPRGDAG